VSSNPARGEVYTIQHYVIQFVSDLNRKKIEIQHKSILKGILKFIFVRFVSLETLQSVQILVGDTM
jgi:hypothetical protein